MLNPTSEAHINIVLHDGTSVSKEFSFSQRKVARCVNRVILGSVEDLNSTAFDLIQDIIK